MILLSLSKFAWVVGAKPKWVLNAAKRLGRDLEYSESNARWLRLVRALNRDLRTPLSLAASLTDRALAVQSQSPRRTVRVLDASVEGLRLTLDLERFQAGFEAAFAAAHVFALGKRAGRKQPVPRRPGSAIVRARRRGVEIWQLRAAVRRSPTEHLAALPSRKLVQRLAAGGVRFTIAGGAAEAVHGAVVQDGQLEICYADSAANINRLARTLRDLNARPRQDSSAIAPTQLALSPFAASLRSNGLALETDLGPVDLRRSIPGIGGFAKAMANAKTVNAFGCEVAVPTLPSLISARRASGTRPDCDRVPMLEALHAIPLWAAPRVLRRS